MTTQEYWNAVKGRICPKCVDGDGTGRCLVDPMIGCALQRQLPLIIATVTKVHSTQMVDYTSELRSVVCHACEHGASDGSCAVRADLACALDRYFPLVVDIVEELQARNATPTFQPPR